MRILLTGATGFIGSTFTRLALRQGHQVTGLIIPTETVPAHLPSHPNLRWLRGTLDTAPWEELREVAPEVCVHTAWITTPGLYLESPLNEWFRDASRAFLLKLAGMGTRRMVVLGTCIEYQVSRQPLSEEHTPLAPTTTYARCKNELRLTLETDAKAQGFEFCWGRVFYPYGPGEHPSRLCSSLIQRFARGEPITLKTPDSTKDYIHVEDVAHALQVLTESTAQGAFNIGTGVGVTVYDLAQTVARLLDRPGLVHRAVPEVEDPLDYVVADSARLRGLGWQPAITLEKGLMGLIDSLTRAPRAVIANPGLPAS